MLFKELSLNNCSVDVIVNEQNCFYFLEINPIGQFGMVSQPCNYYCEKQLVENLILL